LIGGGWPRGEVVIARRAAARHRAVVTHCTPVILHGSERTRVGAG
jgi:hypothetical protein